MIGHSAAYTRFECVPFELPKQIRVEECQMRNERCFIEFLLRNDWIQRKVGIKMDGSNGFFPDIKGEIYDGSGDRITVEVELWAENYKLHGHQFKGCDLILSFYRLPDTRFVKGVPVWSFYEAYKNDRWALLCLNSDINYNFDTHLDYEEMNGLQRLNFNRFGTPFYPGREGA